jgi:hypothetical protein
MTTKTAAKKSASKSSTKPPKSPAAKTGALIDRAKEVLKRYSGNVERAMGEAGAQGDSKLATAIKALGTPTPAAKLPAAAPAPAAKPEPKKTAKKGEAKREVIPGDARITVVSKENPRRAGSLGAKTFALYKTGMTVAEWRDLCRERDADAGYLHADLRNGYIKVG